MVKRFDDLENEIKDLRADIAISNQKVLEAYDKILTSEKQQNMYIKDIHDILVKQSAIDAGKTIALTGWRDGDSLWQNFIRLGLDIIDLIVPARTITAFLR